MIGPNYFVYIAGQGKRDDTKIRGFAEAVKLSLYDAKVMLGAPGPRKVGAFVKEADAQMQALALRQAGFVAFVVEKERFSRLPRIFRALRAVEQPEGLLFTIEPERTSAEDPESRTLDLPQPKGIVKAVLLGYYTQTTERSDGTRTRFRDSTTSKSHVREPFLHLYSEDPHTILEIRSGKFEFPWPQALGTLVGDIRWQKMAEVMAAYYGAKLDTTLFRVPEEVNTITAALNVSVSTGQGGKGATTGTASIDDSPVAMAASRIIVYSIVFGV